MAMIGKVRARANRASASTLVHPMSAAGHHRWSDLTEHWQYSAAFPILYVHPVVSAKRGVSNGSTRMDCTVLSQAPCAVADSAR